MMRIESVARMTRASERAARLQSVVVQPGPRAAAQKREMRKSVSALFSYRALKFNFYFVRGLTHRLSGAGVSIVRRKHDRVRATSPRTRWEKARVTSRTSS